MLFNRLELILQEVKTYLQHYYIFISLIRQKNVPIQHYSPFFDELYFLYLCIKACRYSCVGQGMYEDH